MDQGRLADLFDKMKKRVSLRVCSPCAEFEPPPTSPAVVSPGQHDKRCANKTFGED